jgi:sugar lactone lactonase YvrE
MNRILLILLVLPIMSEAQMITTFAGNGTWGYSGIGGPATAAELAEPRGVAVDNSGNVYIACWGAGSHVLKVNASGIISVFAGNGTTGYSGDGGPATAAELYYPTTVGFDGLGNVYIGDATSKRIRKVTPLGIITTFAGNGTYGNTGDGGPATAAELGYPAGISFDASGNAYIADQDNNNVRKVNSSGIISTFAGNGTAGYSGDGGPATAAMLYGPVRVIVSGSGDIYIDDYSNSRIRKVNSSGVISLIAGNGTTVFGGDGGQATAAELAGPVGIASDIYGNIFIADMGNNRIRMVNSLGVIKTIAGTGVAGYNGDCIQATFAELNAPIGVAVDGSGHIFFSEDGGNRIRILSASCDLAINNVPYNSEPITIFPNPTTASLTISSPDQITTVSITSLIGQTVYNHEYNSIEVHVDVADLPKGIYFVKVNGSGVRKFVKQ